VRKAVDLLKGPDRVLEGFEQPIVRFIGVVRGNAGDHRFLRLSIGAAEYRARLRPVQTMI
jgi:hypothetical protein